MIKTKKSKINNSLIIFSLVVIVFGGFILMDFSQKRNQKSVQNQVTRQNCLAEDCLSVDGLTYPAGELSASVKDALNQAINDEYKAYSTYEAAIKKLGNVRPFSMIIRAEEQHISALKSIYDKYGLTIPENTLAKKVTAPDTLQQACQTGVDAEIANATLYRDKLLPAVTDYEDITQVFENLMNASQQKHLPAFERCK